MKTFYLRPSSKDLTTEIYLEKSLLFSDHYQNRDGSAGLSTVDKESI